MKLVRNVLAVVALAVSAQAWSADPAATPTCNSGPQSGWQSTKTLKQHLIKQSITVQTVKIVGDCYAVYAVTHIGQPANSYYHPVTLKVVGPIPN
jgi:hypothetical protein